MKKNVFSAKLTILQAGLAELRVLAKDAEGPERAAASGNLDEIESSIKVAHKVLSGQG